MFVSQIIRVVLFRDPSILNTPFTSHFFLSIFFSHYISPILLIFFFSLNFLFSLTKHLGVQIKYIFPNHNSITYQKLIYTKYITTGELLQSLLASSLITIYTRWYKWSDHILISSHKNFPSSYGFPCVASFLPLRSLF